MARSQRLTPPAPKKLSLKRQTLKDLTPPALGAEKVKGGVSRQINVIDDTRFCVAQC